MRKGQEMTEEMRRKRLAIFRNPEWRLSQSRRLKGHSTSEKVRLRASKLNLGKFGDNHPSGGSKHPAWKGENVGYLALHAWIRRRKGTPDTCEHCKKTGLKGKSIHWANTNHEYQRKLSDWIRLCTKCHRQYDITNGYVTSRWAVKAHAERLNEKTSTKKMR